jgi:membrane associated rhomboid family serine protease
MHDQPRRERMLNVPVVVVALLAALGLIHAFLVLALTAEQTTEALLLFAFIPARYDPSVLPDVVWPGGFAADVWTFVTYALLHGDITHLVFNGVWLLAFGSPVAQRFGALRFMYFMAATAAAGAAVHLATHFGEILPMIGSSAAVSGAMAAAMRACSPSWWFGSGSTYCSGSFRSAAPASRRRWPGRRISADSWPAFSDLLCSIRFRPRPR